MKRRDKRIGEVEAIDFVPFCHVRLFSIFFGPAGRSEGLGWKSRGLRPGNQYSRTKMATELCFQNIREFKLQLFVVV